MRRNCFARALDRRRAADEVDRKRKRRNGSVWCTAVILTVWMVFIYSAVMSYRKALRHTKPMVSEPFRACVVVPALAYLECTNDPDDPMLKFWKSVSLLQLPKERNI